MDGRIFEQRKKELIQKAALGSCHLHVAMDGTRQSLAGYCASYVIPGHEGEVESLYVAPAYRKYGIGKVFMESALAWMESHRVPRKKLSSMPATRKL
jgi:ribosomal protein S18 acetylase RimI-like enzyme